MIYLNSIFQMNYSKKFVWNLLYFYYTVSWNVLDRFKLSWTNWKFCMRLMKFKINSLKFFICFLYYFQWANSKFSVGPRQFEWSKIFLPTVIYIPHHRRIVSYNKINQICFLRELQKISYYLCKKYFFSQKSKKE